MSSIILRNQFRLNMTDTKKPLVKVASLCFISIGSTYKTYFLIDESKTGETNFEK